MKLNPIGNNQNEVEMHNGKIIFYSYKTPVAIFVPGKGAFCTTEKFSKTTSKHVNRTIHRWDCTRNDISPEEFQKLL